MAPNRITRGAAMRRALLVLALTRAGRSASSRPAAAGGASDSSAAPTDKEADAERPQRNPHPPGSRRRRLPTRSCLRCTAASSAWPRSSPAQEQEHVDATLKALRGLGEAEAAPETEEIEVAGRKTPAEYLDLLYEMESATINAELAAVAKLTGSARSATLMATTRRQPGPAPGPAAARPRRQPGRNRASSVRDRRNARPVRNDCANDRPPLRDWSVLLAPSLAGDRGLAGAGDRPGRDRPGRRQQDQRKPDAARHRLDDRDRTARRQPARSRPTAATRW